MILEFCGLPGAGKSTLERELVAILAQRGHPLLLRDEAVIDYIRAKLWSGYSQTSAMRRFATAAYKASLLRATFAPRIMHHNPVSFAKVHLLRTSMRLAEDIRLSEWFAFNLPATSLLVLSEGVIQHLSACHAWQDILRRRERSGSVAASITMHDQPHHRVIIHVNVPIDVALKRLRRRCVPAKWPNGVSPKTVVDAFSRALPHTMARQACNQNITILPVDGTAAEADWPTVAASLAKDISLVGCSAKGII